MWNSTRLPGPLFPRTDSFQRRQVKMRSMKFSRSPGSWSRPSSSTGSRGKRSMNIRAKMPDAGLARHAVRVIDLNPLHAARRRVALKDKTAEVLLLELVGRFSAHASIRSVWSTVGLKVTSRGASGSPTSLQGLPGYAEAALHLGAHGHVFDVFSQGVHEVAVELVAAVVADVLPQQAGADSQAYFLHAA